MGRSISLWLAMALCLGALTPVAHAADPPATYVVSMCRSEGRPLPLVEWRQSAGGRPFENACASGGAFGFEASGWGFSESPLSRSWSWSAPENVSAVGLRSYGVVQSTRIGARLTADGHSGDFG